MALKPKKEPKIAPSRNRRVWLERRAFELSNNCPAEHSNPLNCPLFGLRPLRAEARRVWISGLSDDELEYLATYHVCCYAEKTAHHAAGGRRADRQQRRGA